MNRYRSNVLVAGLVMLLVGVWASMPAPGSERHGLRAVVEDVATDVKRATIWRWTAYRELAQKRIVSTHEAAVLSKRVWRITDGEMQFRGPHWLMAWRRKPTATSAQALADTTWACPECYGGGAIALDHPEESARDSVLEGVWPQIVWFVDSLGTAADTSVGSFVAAVDSAAEHLDAKNHIHFRASGQIWLPSRFSDSYNDQLEHLVIAGQTAPGGGIQFVRPWRWRGDQVPGTHDIVFRYIRWNTRANFNLYTGRGGLKRLLIDRSSFRWAAKVGGSATLAMGCDTALNGDVTDGSCQDFTIQRSMLYEPDEDHATIASGGGGTPKDVPPGSRVFWFRNFYMGPGWRTPAVGGGQQISIWEGVEYARWGQSWPAIWTGRRGQNDVYQYYTKPGPGTATNTRPRRGTVRWFGNTESCPGAGVDNCGNDGDKDPPQGDTTNFVGGLRCQQNNWEINADPDSLWEGSGQCVFNTESSSDTVPPEYRRFTPAPIPYREPQITTMTDAHRDLIVDSAGAIHRVNADGDLVLNIDPPDSTRKHWFHNGLGPSNGVDIDTMSLPDLSGGTPPTDSDANGMPDGFESRYSISDPTGDPDSDGYTNLDEYENGTDPTSSDAGGGGNGGGGGTTTYGDGRIVHLVPAVPDTLVYGAGADTLISMVPDPDSVPKGTYCFTIPDPDLSHVYVATYDVLSPQPGVLDSAVVADSMANLGTARDPRTDRCFGQ